MQLAAAAKDSATSSPMDAAPPVPVSEWFLHTPTPRVVPYASIAHHADEEYAKWRTIDPEYMEHFHDEADNLNAWILGLSEDALADIIDRTPSGLAACEHTGVSVQFTAWQRISMAYYVEAPFATTSKITTLESAITRICHGGVRRRIPMASQRSLQAGVCRDVGIVDLPTAAGKTAWSLCVAYLLAGPRFDAIVGEYHAKMAGTLVHGSPCLQVARLVLVSASATTFDHFAQTLRRLVPIFESMAAYRVEVWTTMGQVYTAKHATTRPPGTIVFWIIPASSFTTTLRLTPDVAIPVCVTDEYIVDPPRERAISHQSSVLKHMIMLATPQALVSVTMSGRSWLRRYFGGGLTGPRSIHRMLENREWNAAQLAIDQACMLDLMTTTLFRNYVRSDLRHLVPPSLVMLTVLSKRLTITSSLLDMQTDMVPSSLCNVVLGLMADANLDDASRVKVRSVLENAALTPAQLRSAFEFLPAVGCITRMLTRIDEFQQACPICFGESGSSFRIFGCCGYCVCEECYTSCHNQCAFCRTPVRSHMPRALVESADATLLRERTVVEGDYPSRPLMLDDVANRPSITTSMAQLCMPHLSQKANLSLTLHCLAAYGYRRTVVVIECHGYYHRAAGTTLDYAELGQRTGYAVTPVYNLMGGKGTLFKPVKDKFDSSDPMPMAIVCKSTTEKFLIGTDITSVDSLVTVGDIPQKTLTQIIGRLFRPNSLRDNTKPILATRVITGGRMLPRSS